MRERWFALGQGRERPDAGGVRAARLESCASGGWGHMNAKTTSDRPQTVPNSQAQTMLHQDLDAGLVRAATDITERQFARDELATIIESIGDGLMILDEEWRFVYLNAAGEKLLGERREDVLGKNHWEIYPSALGTSLEANYRKAAAGEPQDFETYWPPWQRWFHSRVYPRPGGGIAVYFLDITASKRAEEALRDSEARLRAIVHAVPDMLAVLDDEGRYLEVLTTRPQPHLPDPGALLGQQLDEVLATEDARTGLEALRQTLRTGEPQGFEYIWPDGSAEPRVFEARVAPLDEPFAGRRPAAVMLARDVTRQRLIEASLRQAQKLEAVGQLTGGIAHDFNNLLAVIQGNLELFVESFQDRDPELGYRVREALAAAERGASLTRRLLIFARRQPLRPKRIDLNQVVTDLNNLLHRSLGETVALQTRLAPDLLPTVVDPNQLEVALLNLAVNARDAMPDGGQLTIETANYWLHEDAAHAALHGVAAGQYVALAMSDTGRGMTADVQRRAFEPFFTTKEAGRGTGLGLSMVHGLVDQSGGFVHLYSKVGQGTTVRLHFPAAEAADASVDAGTSAGPLRSDPELRQAILVVEDESAVRRLAVRMLESLGYRTVEADTAEAALAVLEATQEVVALFTDVVLPGTASGVDLARQALRRRPDLRVLFVSGYAEAHLSRFEDRPPGSDFLDKPYLKAQLAEKLRVLLDGGGTGASR